MFKFKYIFLKYFFSFLSFLLLAHFFLLPTALNKAFKGNDEKNLSQGLKPEPNKFANFVC